MKKIDKVILSSFLGPFFLTFFVVVFILLNIQMLKYFDDIIGKDLGWDVLGTLVFYFAIFTTPTAMPLAVLLSSLIAFGNLGEHFELTAIKSLGISLVRSLLPIFIFTTLLTVVAFYINNYMVPKAALEAYSLLYDIKQKKPALDLKEGTFFSSIPDVSIKVNNKHADGQTLDDIIIYDHRGKVGNKDVTIADSGKMYTILNDQYLKLELFNGYNYSEGAEKGEDFSGRGGAGQNLRKTKFSKSQIVFDLASFGLNRTDKKWFQGNRIMRNLKELEMDMDSVGYGIRNQEYNAFNMSRHHAFLYHFKSDTVATPAALIAEEKRIDSLSATKSNKQQLGLAGKENIAVLDREKPIVKEYENPDSINNLILVRSDSMFNHKADKAEISAALAQARLIKSQLLNYGNQIATYTNEYKVFQIQWHKILSNSVACLVMFLIGAPLGAIIKRGGLGVPVLASIIFFIVFYIMTMMGEKWAKQSMVSVPVGIWTANAILFVIGLLFLRQARVDARLFEADFYRVIWDKAKTWLIGRKMMKQAEG